MSMHRSAGVPGIPRGALNAISDENTRMVLQAIADGLDMRNGFTGNKDNRFITEKELTRMATTGSLNVLIRNTAQQVFATQGGKEDDKLDSGELSRVMSDLHAQVFESRLFHDLRQRIDLIDKPGGIFERLERAETVLVQESEQRIEEDTALSARIDVMGTRVGDAETAILTEQTQRVNADNALQQTIATQYASVRDSMALIQDKQNTSANQAAAMATELKQIQASVAGHSAAIREEKEVRAALLDYLYAQWTLRLDVNGHVAGVGLANTGKTSDFIVRADRFSIVSPHGDRAAVIMRSNTIYVFDENGQPRVAIGRLG